MRFSLVLTTSKPQKFNVLDAETPKSGASFLMYASACLRRSLDDTSRFRHQTLGALASYTMAVPQQIALESGLFNDTATYTITVSENVLEPYIFYGATLSAAGSNRPCYPYTTNEIVLTSFIDELRFIFDWQATGFAPKVKLNSNGQLVRDSSPDDDDDGKKGQGCDGCPVHPPYGPGPGRPGGWPPPPPSPWYRPGPNTPAYPAPQPPFPPAPPAPKPAGGSGAIRPTGTSNTASTSGIAPGTIMLGDDILTSEQFNALFDDK